MADPIRADELLTASVLDRLLDDEPDVATEPVHSQAQVLRTLRQSVRRDLENLLNTRYRCVSWPPNLDQLENSLVNYGIPDFTSAGYDAGEDSTWLLSAIENAIRMFEPRVTRVKVHPLESGAALSRTLSFRIDAELNVESFSESLRFESALDATTGQFSVEGTST